MYVPMNVSLTCLPAHLPYLPNVRDRGYTPRATIPVRRGEQCLSEDNAPDWWKLSSFSGCISVEILKDGGQKIAERMLNTGLMAALLNKFTEDPKRNWALHSSDPWQCGGRAMAAISRGLAKLSEEQTDTLVEKWMDFCVNTVVLYTAVPEEDEGDVDGMALYQASMGLLRLAMQPKHRPRLRLLGVTALVKSKLIHSKQESTGRKVFQVAGLILAMLLGREEIESQAVPREIVLTLVQKWKSIINRDSLQSGGVCDKSLPSHFVFFLWGGGFTGMGVTGGHCWDPPPPPI